MLAVKVRFVGSFALRWSVLTLNKREGPPGRMVPLYGFK